MTHHKMIPGASWEAISHTFGFSVSEQHLINHFHLFAACLLRLASVRRNVDNICLAWMILVSVTHRWMYIYTCVCSCSRKCASDLRYARAYTCVAPRNRTGFSCIHGIHWQVWWSPGSSEAPQCGLFPTHHRHLSLGSCRSSLLIYPARGAWMLIKNCTRFSCWIRSGFWGAASQNKLHWWWGILEAPGNERK